MSLRARPRVKRPAKANTAGYQSRQRGHNARPPVFNTAELQFSTDATVGFEDLAMAERSRDVQGKALTTLEGLAALFAHAIALLALLIGDDQTPELRTGASRRSRRRGRLTGKHR